MSRSALSPISSNQAIMVDMEVNAEPPKLSSTVDTLVGESSSHMVMSMDLSNTADCNGHKPRLENVNGKDDARDGSYVFIDGNDLVAAADLVELQDLNGHGEGDSVSSSQDQCLGTVEEQSGTSAVEESDTSFPLKGEGKLEREERVEAESSVLDTLECEVTEREDMTLGDPQADQSLSSSVHEELSGETNSDSAIRENQDSQIEEKIVHNEGDQMRKPSEIDSPSPHDVTYEDLELEEEQNLENPVADVQIQEEPTYTHISDKNGVISPSGHAPESGAGSVLSTVSLDTDHSKAEENGHAHNVETLPSPPTETAFDEKSASDSITELLVADIPPNTRLDGDDSMANEHKENFLSTQSQESVSNPIFDIGQNRSSDNANSLSFEVVHENLPVEVTKGLLTVDVGNMNVNSGLDSLSGVSEVKESDVKENGYLIPTNDMGIESGVRSDHSNGIYKADVDSSILADSNPGMCTEVKTEVTVPLDNVIATCEADDARKESVIDEAEVNSDESADNPKEDADIEAEASVNDFSTKDAVSSGFSTNDVETATETSFNSINSEEKSRGIANNLSADSTDGETHIGGLIEPTNDKPEAESSMNNTGGREDNTVVTKRNEDQFTGVDDTTSILSARSPEDSTVDDVSEEQTLPAEPVKRPFYYLINIPRYDDENLKAQIREANLQLSEKTQSRDASQPETQMRKAKIKEFVDSFKSAKFEEKALRDLLVAKRKEMDSLQVVSKRARDASTLEGIEGMIQNLELKLNHGTQSLKEEKLLMRDIKQYKQQRELVYSSLGTQGEVQEAIEQKKEIEERLKALRREADLLKVKINNAAVATRDAKKKCDEESEKLDQLRAQWGTADLVRQEAFAHLQSSKKLFAQRENIFFNLRANEYAVNNLVSLKAKEELQQYCVNQVEGFMEQWNSSSEFRNDYMRCNMRSTLYRLKTLDGRSLGPDEEPPVIPHVIRHRVVRDVPLISSNKAEIEVSPVDVAKADDKPIMKFTQQKNQATKTPKPTKHAISLATVSVIDEIPHVAEEEVHKPPIQEEEEESAKKAEQLRKEEAKLKEQRRLEEKAKAAEALERKKRTAAKAQAKAAIRAQKEAEQKEKEREKKARKKDKRKAAATGEDVVNDDNEGESASAYEAVKETTTTHTEGETKEKAVARTKRRPQKAPQFKAKTIPPHLQNRSKRGTKTWMWGLVATLILLGLFLLGNSGGISYDFVVRGFGF